VASPFTTNGTTDPSSVKVAEAADRRPKLAPVMVAVWGEFEPSQYRYGETKKSNFGPSTFPVYRVRFWPYWLKTVHVGAVPYVHEPSCNLAEIVDAVDPAPAKTAAEGTQRRIC